MTYFVPCPKCSPPNTKGVRCYGVAGERLQWIRLRRLDTCRCVLTPFEDAFVIRSARMEGQPIDHKREQVATAHRGYLTELGE